MAEGGLVAFIRPGVLRHWDKWSRFCGIPLIGTEYVVSRFQPVIATLFRFMESRKWWHVSEVKPCPSPQACKTRAVFAAPVQSVLKSGYVASA